MSFFDPALHSASAHVVEDVEGMHLSLEAFERLAQLQPSFLGTSTVIWFSIIGIFLNIFIVGGWLHALFNFSSNLTDVPRLRSGIPCLQT